MCMRRDASSAVARGTAFSVPMTDRVAMVAQHLRCSLSEATDIINGKTQARSKEMSDQAGSAGDHQNSRSLCMMSNPSQIKGGGTPLRCSQRAEASQAPLGRSRSQDVGAAE